MSDKHDSIVESLRSGKSIAVLDKETVEVKTAFVQLEENEVEHSEKYKDFSSGFEQKINKIVEAKKPFQTAVYENERSILPQKEEKPVVEKNNLELIPDEAFEEVEDTVDKVKTIEPEKQVDVEQEQLVDELEKTELEEIQEDMVSPVSKTRKMKFRFKLVAIVFSIVTLLVTGLCIHNSVRINKLNVEIQQAQTEYSVNIEKYIRKVNKLDNLNNDDNVVDNVQDVSPFPADRILVGTPESLSEPAEVVVQNNWFNNLLDKITRFFGRK